MSTDRLITEYDGDGAVQYTVITEDGKHVTDGEQVFNYYDRKAGYIERGTIESDGWFYVKQEDGTKTALNGERICSMEFARAKGWAS